MGGEKACLAAVSLALAGSPPRGRGKGTATKALKQELRFTPA